MFGTLSADTQKWFDQNQTRRSAKPISASKAASSLALNSLRNICRSGVTPGATRAGIAGALGDDVLRLPLGPSLKGGARRGCASQEPAIVNPANARTLQLGEKRPTR